MQRNRLSALFLFAIFVCGDAIAQDSENGATDATEDLKIAAIEALISAPPHRALPIIKKVLSGNHSNDLKERALFILSQLDIAEAQQILLDTAKNGSGELRNESIRMIGIGGDTDALRGLAEIYASGDAETKESVLEAYLIADDAESVYQIAANSSSDGEFETAVDILGAMGATEQLRKLRGRGGSSESLVQAYAIAGDYESLSEMAHDISDPETQMHAISGLGIVGGEQVNTTLMSIYHGTDNADVKEAALEGMMISGYDAGVLELFRASDDPAEKRELLEMLVIMDSDEVLDLIDQMLDGN